MKAIRYEEYGGPEVLKLVEVDTPQPGPQQIRIAVKAAGVNPLDWKLRSGAFAQVMPTEFPAGVGFEAAGVVDAVGEGVSDVAVGDAVFGPALAAMAEFAVLTSWARKPEDMPFEVAASLSVATDVANRALNQIGVKAGETLLVSNAAGGVGSILVQIARHRGITVIGTASPQQQDHLRALGIIPTTFEPGLVERARQLSPSGYDAALDLIGSGVVPELVEIVGVPSKVLSIVDFAAPQHGAQFLDPTPVDPTSALSEIAKVHAEGGLRVHVEKTFPLAQLADAQTLSAGGQVTGKLVITLD